MPSKKAPTKATKKVVGKATKVPPKATAKAPVEETPAQRKRRLEEEAKMKGHR
jgi:hypothetical protein